MEKRKNFFTWYLDKFKKSTVFTILASIVVIFGAIGTVYGGLKALEPLYNFVVKKDLTPYVKSSREIAYEKISKINTGIHINYLKPIIEEPIKTRGLSGELKGYSEYLYADNFFFLQIIINEEGAIVAYAVTLIEDYFKPELPKIFSSSNKILKLGDITFSDINNPVAIIAGFNGMAPFYEEQYYFGNPGFYKMYFLNWSPSGIQEELSDRDYDILYKLAENKNKYKKAFTLNSDIFREEFIGEEDSIYRYYVKPNTYGVIQEWAENDLIKYISEERNGIGVDRYDVRDIEIY